MRGYSRQSNKKPHTLANFIAKSSWFVAWSMAASKAGSRIVKYRSVKRFVPNGKKYPHYSENLLFLPPMTNQSNRLETPNTPLFRLH
jgi:hypothetical protein